MTPTEDELADVFESLVPTELDVELGERKRHDAAPGRLRVDFVYDSATPDAIALEVTSIQWEDMRAQRSNLELLSDDLREVAERESAGSWLLEVTGDRWTASERNAVREWVIGGLEVTGDLDEVIVPDNMGAIGVMRFRRGSGDGNAVSIFGMSPVVGVSGFSNKLLSVCVSNASKMLEARPRATHLLVLVAFLMGSRDIGSTLVPPRINETEGVDFIWVIHQGDQHSDQRPLVWWAELGDSDWNTIPRRA